MTITLGEAIETAQRGLERWKAKPHNAKWWRRIDGTPIPNDLIVNIAEQFAEEHGKDCMIKRVAHAIEETRRRMDDPYFMAHAAILAMREPTQEMLDVGADRVFWQTMIDEALKVDKPAASGN
jgi:hypothetical protein